MSQNNKKKHPKKEAMLSALEQHLGVVTDSCKEVGINRTTHYRWLEEDPEYKHAVDDIGEASLDFAESELFRQIRNGNTTATIFYLKTKGRRRGYIEKVETEHSGSIQISKIERTVIDPNVGTKD